MIEIMYMVQNTSLTSNATNVARILCDQRVYNLNYQIIGQALIKGRYTPHKITRFLWMRFKLLFFLSGLTGDLIGRNRLGNHRYILKYASRTVSKNLLLGQMMARMSKTDNGRELLRRFFKEQPTRKMNRKYGRRVNYALSQKFWYVYRCRLIASVIYWWNLEKIREKVEIFLTSKSHENMVTGGIDHE